MIFIQHFFSKRNDLANFDILATFLLLCDIVYEVKVKEII